jgi:hypothetical protein
MPKPSGHSELFLISQDSQTRVLLTDLQQGRTVICAPTCFAKVAWATKKKMTCGEEWLADRAGV